MSFRAFPRGRPADRREKRTLQLHVVVVRHLEQRLAQLRLDGRLGAVLVNKRDGDAVVGWCCVYWGGDLLARVGGFGAESGWGLEQRRFGELGGLSFGLLAAAAIDTPPRADTRRAMIDRARD